VMGLWSQLTEPRVASNFAGSSERNSTRFPETSLSSYSSAPGSRDASQIDSTLKALYLIEPVLDFRQRGGTEVVAPGQWRAMLGFKYNTTTGAFLGTVPTALREAVSAAAYIERGHTRGWVPTMIAYATDVLVGTATWTGGTNTITNVGAFALANYGFQAGDKVRVFKEGVGAAVLSIATRASDDAITTTEQWTASNLTDISYEILVGLPYGTTPGGGPARDPHNDQDIKKWIDLASSKGLVVSGDKYSSYSADNAKKAYTFLAQQVGC
jgi:hypothetical protein